MMESLKLDHVIALAKRAGASVSRRSIWPPTFRRSIDFTPEQLELFSALLTSAVQKEAKRTAAQLQKTGIAIIHNNEFEKDYSNGVPLSDLTGSSESAQAGEAK